MIKAHEFPGKTFASKEELFHALKESKSEIIALKTSEIKSSDTIAIGVFTDKDSTAIKGMRMESDYIYPVINTTKFMDSHNDVHMDGIWNKSVREQQGKIYYLADHNKSLTSVIAYPKDVEMMIKEFTFKELGVDLEGSTQALVFKIAKNKIRLTAASDVITENIPIEHSVCMNYVMGKLDLAVNSDDEEFAEAKKVWDEVYPIVANKDRADSQGYFWAVREAKIYTEGSMVLAGSNSATPLLQRKTEPLKDTQDKGAGTATSAKQFFINLTK